MAPKTGIHKDSREAVFDSLRIRLCHSAPSRVGEFADELLVSARQVPDERLLRAG
jgi:hypothetical protein